MGGYDHSQIGKSLCCQSVSRSVGRSVGISNQSVSKKKRKECIPVGRDDEKEESRRLDVYRKMPRH